MPGPPPPTPPSQGGKSATKSGSTGNKCKTKFSSAHPYPSRSGGRGSPVPSARSICAMLAALERGLWPGVDGCLGKQTAYGQDFFGIGALDLALVSNCSRFHPTAFLHLSVFDSCFIRGKENSHLAIGFDFRLQNRRRELYALAAHHLASHRHWLRLASSQNARCELDTC